MTQPAALQKNDQNRASFKHYDISLVRRKMLRIKSLKYPKSFQFTLNVGSYIFSHSLSFQDAVYGEVIMY